MAVAIAAELVNQTRFADSIPVHAPWQLSRGQRACSRGTWRWSSCFAPGAASE